MDRLKECQVYVKRWYMGEPVLAIRMTIDDGLEELVQLLVVEMIRDLIDNPIPDGIVEGSPQFNTWVHSVYVKACSGTDPGIPPEEESAIKNLAWTYYINGITRTQKSTDEARLYKCTRRKTIQ